MPFDPLTWALTFALNRAGGKSLDRLNQEKLTRDLLKITEKWSKELSYEEHLNINALFPDVSGVEDHQDRPALSLLRNELNQRVPRSVFWLNAFVEQWKLVRARNQESQPFFKLEEARARELMAGLSQKIERRCKRDNDLFKLTVLEALDNLKAAIAPAEGDTAREIVSLLEVRGLFYRAFDIEMPMGCYRSASEIRDLMAERTGPFRCTRLYEYCDQIQVAMEEFKRTLDQLGIHEINNELGHGQRKNGKLIGAIKVLRRKCAAPLSGLCKYYDIEANERLSAMLSLLNYEGP